jgi:hypothetical protein
MLRRVSVGRHGALGKLELQRFTVAAEVGQAGDGLRLGDERFVELCGGFGAQVDVHRGAGGEGEEQRARE